MINRKTLSHISVFIILLIGCGSSTSNNDDKHLIDTIHAQRFEDNTKLKIDTLRDPSHQSYLSDLSLRQVGRLILTDSIQPSDNNITFDCMDSLSSENVSTRDYFFPVFLKILDKCDGALAEAVGLYTMTYFEKYPYEFAEKSKSITNEQFYSWASFTGNELYFTYESEKQVKSWLNSVVKNCSSCEATHLKRLKEFNKFAISAIKDAFEN